MTEKDMIIMSQKESNRLYVIRQTIDKAITQGQAAEILGLTDRQVRRIARSVRRKGSAGICHKSRGKRSHNRIADSVKDKATPLWRNTYKKFGATQASEKLLKLHKIKVSDGSIIHAASGNVSGYVLNQYSMDEYNGFFRVATSNGTATGVYCLVELAAPDEASACWLLPIPALPLGYTAALATTGGPRPVQVSAPPP